MTFIAGKFYFCKLNGKTYHCFRGENGLRFRYDHKGTEYTIDVNGFNPDDFIESDEVTK